MARDIFHDAVRHALVKDGWTITDDPFRLSVEGVNLQIDLGAERLIAATKEDERIAVEVKSFIGNSDLSEFHTALGQYLNYRIALSSQAPDRKLYLAIPEDTFNSFFQLAFPRSVLEQFDLSILIYDSQQEILTQWIR
jgi:hypothetical protein